MLVNFRQGIVSYPVGFLQKVGVPVGSRVALSIDPAKPLVLHFAHRNTNYLVVQKTSVGLTPPVGAFGPHLSGVDYWLYADINLQTGVVTWGSTTLEPVNQQTTPTNTQTIPSDASPTELVQVAGRHWFKTGPSTPADDLLYPPYTMFVRNAGNTAWEEKVRVFVARYEEAANFISVSVNAGNPNTAIKFGGTQVGNVTTNNAGYLIYDSNSVAFKNSDGTFVTTEDVLKTGMLLGADMKVGNYVVQAIADAAFPAYTVVRFPTFGHVTPVNLFNFDQSFFGLVESSASIGEMKQVILEGLVTNAAWAWTTANAPIYVDNSGQLTETRPSINDADPVAFAVSPTQVVLRSSRVEVGLVDHASDTEFGAVRLDVAPPAEAGYIDILYAPTVGAGGLPASSTGLAVTNTYTAEIIVDGTTYNVTYGPTDMPNYPLTTVPLISDLLTFLNTALLGVATVSLESTTVLRITSDTSGPTSSVRLTSGSAVLPNLDLFESIANYDEIDEPVDGYWDSVAASSGSLAAHIADTTVHLSAEQNSLLDLLDAAAVGVLVKSAEGAMVSRTLTAGSSKVSVTNGTGVAGNPTVDVVEANVVHQNLSGAGVATHAQLDTHVLDATIHFTEASIDHANILNVGTNTHAQLDTHVANAAIHFTLPITQADVTNLVTDLAAKYDEVVAVNGNFAAFATAGATLVDSGSSAASFTPAAHASDATLHLTADQNTFLDALNVPTLVAADVNQLAGITVANDAAVVHLAGTETVTGVKTFSNAFNVLGDTVNGNIVVSALGVVDIAGSPGTAAAGADVTVEAGDGAIGFAGGWTTVRAGDGSGDAGGSVDIVAGSGTPNGTVILRGASGDCVVADGAQNVQVGASAPAIGATDGFLYIPLITDTTNAGPSGTPTAKAGFVPLVAQYDSDGPTNYRLWVYINGAWRSTTLT